MPQGKWRHDAVYENKHSLDAPGYAFEYLRRNGKFVRDQRRLERMLLHGQLTDKLRNAFANRWGMRFREGHTRRRTTDDPVDDDSSTERRRPCTCPCSVAPLSNTSYEISARLDRRQ
jgi:hypothetical protein